ncbi:MAG TPA: thiolase family protein [Smithellaceae bacterium]|nr:thiolase family protein [Smithellaceae bacterium]HPL96140.1 thiolase family protein [Smithellaceae bacterium]HQF83860.1 thiolase family protein [Smithellaceae bacterium]HQG79996.1 thiolase family protein [Smithellaceae bacterium]
MENVVFISCARTPIGAYGGSLKDVAVYRLAGTVLKAAVQKAGIEPEQVDDVIMASAYQNGECANGARMAVLDADWPDTIPGGMIDRRCCSGLESVYYAALQIQTGNADIVVAGGMESMSQGELYVPGDIKWGLGGKSHEKYGFMPRGHGALAMWGIPLYDRIQRGRVMSQPIWRYGELSSMMTWAETAARNEKITREEADRWALRSHQRAVAAQEAGKFRDEIVPVLTGRDKSGQEIYFSTDEGPRKDTTLERLAKLKPVYEGGVCTAGNSSSENDGAAVVILASERKAKDLGIRPLAYYRSCAIAATDPTLTYPAVPAAVKKALQKAGQTINEMDLIEVQEAFAVQCLADSRLAGLSDEQMDAKVNVNGSGISLGHPIGATGTMRLVTLLGEIERRDARFALETICGGGGQGICMVIERK